MIYLPERSLFSKSPRCSFRGLTIIAFLKTLSGCQLGLVDLFMLHELLALVDFLGVTLGDATAERGGAPAMRQAEPAEPADRVLRLLPEQQPTDPSSQGNFFAPNPSASPKIRSSDSTGGEARSSRGRGRHRNACWLAETTEGSWIRTARPPSGSQR